MSRHEQLWAPWRIGYIRGDEISQPRAPDQARLAWLDGADGDCFICRAVASQPSADRENLLVARRASVATILNRYPYNNGHILIAPTRHKGRLDELAGEESADIAGELNRMVCLLERVLGAEGFNIGLNLGRAAGAGLPGHLHWHIVPRWSGDTNFMSVVDSVRVIPQALDELWTLLTGAARDRSSP